MKAEINSKGCLIISAESELESYALFKWSQGYNFERIHPTSCDSMLLIECAENYSNQSEGGST